MTGKSSSLPAAAIFDMDGVLVDSNPFHLRKWVKLLRERNVAYNAGDLPLQLFGQRNDVAFRFFFGADLSEEEVRRMGEVLEEHFRRDFKPHARPLPGLEALLRCLQAANIPMAVASSATRPNIEFIVEALQFRPFFRSLISGEDVQRPKPDPEIYLKSADALAVNPEACVAFEDSFVGIEAVKAAGMKCVAIASTFSIADLRSQTSADLVVRDFTELTLEVLQRLFDGRDGIL